jgi:hypothetical protein
MFICNSVSTTGASIYWYCSVYFDHQLNLLSAGLYKILILFFKDLFGRRVDIIWFVHLCFETNNCIAIQIKRIQKSLMKLYSVRFSFCTCTTWVQEVSTKCHTNIPCLWLGPSWSCSYGSWIYSYLCNQCLSPLRD